MSKSFFLKKPIWILAVILCLGLALRLYNIDTFGLAGDEKYSLFVSQFTSIEGNNQQNSVRNPNTSYFTPKEFWSKKDFSDFNEAIARTDTGNGALFTFILHYWTLLFGVQDFQLRFLPVVFNLLTIIVLYFFSKKVFKSIQFSIFVSFLATISPFFINYSQIARNYSLQFFFTLLSSYLLILILDDFKNNKSIKTLVLLYGLSVLFAKFCHLSVFSLYFAHGIYVIIFHRNIKLIFTLLAAYIIPIVGLILWLISDGGKWLFHFVINSVETYNIIAKKQPDEFLSVASFSTVFKQLRHVLSCLFMSFEGLYLKLNGLKNFIITFVFGFLAYVFFVLLTNEKVKFFSITIIIFLNLLIVTVSKFHYLVLFSNVFLICYIIHHLKSKIQQNNAILLLLLIAIIPLIFLILLAFKDGNTFRIISRYVGFCYATNLMFFMYFLFEFFKEKSYSKYLILSGFLVQFFFLIGLIQSIYIDKAPRYFSYYSEKRTKNPYTNLAQTIQEKYQKGDTVLYCSYNNYSTPNGFNLPQYSVVDAQLTNFYLPKNAEYIQRVDKNEPDKVFIKKMNGDKIELFDFKGVKYRY